MDVGIAGPKTCSASVDRGYGNIAYKARVEVIKGYVVPGRQEFATSSAPARIRLKALLNRKKIKRGRFPCARSVSHRFIYAARVIMPQLITATAQAQKNPDKKLGRGQFLGIAREASLNKHNRPHDKANRRV